MDTRYPRHKKIKHPKADARHRKRYRRHKHNPCPHAPRQLNSATELVGTFFKHPGRKRHNHWNAKFRWTEVNVDSDGFPLIVLRYRVEIDYSADGIDWFLASRHTVSAKDDFDANHADHLIIHHIHGRLAYRFRVRAESRDCKADWSGYYVLGTPDDTPPAPHDVRILRASHGIRVRWHAPVDVEDDEIFDQDIAYFVAQMWTNPDFGPSLSFTALASNDTFTTSAHGMSDGDTVMLSGTTGGPTLPGGTRPWKVYHVDVLSSTTFKLVTEESGLPINLTTNGDGLVHVGLARTARHVHRHHHRFRVDPDQYDEDVKFYVRVRSHSDHRAKSAWIPATAPEPNDDPDATPTGRRPLWHRHGGLTFTIPNAVQEKIYRVPHRMEDDYIIRRVTAAADRVGTGGSTHFDIKINGGPYVFALTGADQVKLNANDHDGTSKAISNNLLSRGDHIRVRCTQVAPVPPRDVTIHIVADRLAPRELAAVDSGGGGGLNLTLLSAKGRSQTTSNLYSVNEDASGETSIGAIGFAMTSLAQDPTTGILYGSTSTNSSAHPKSLVTVDPVTGAGTFIAAFSSGFAMPGLAIADDGTFYGVNTNNPGGGADFSSIDPSTAVESVIGSATIGNAGTGLAFDGDGVLWGMDYADIGTIDLGTGVFTSVYAVTGLSGSAILGLTYLDGLLWGLDPAASNTSSLFTVDLATGTISIIGTVATTYLDALTWLST
jgi:hypothetical protein